jgi:hypothetical protein
MSSEVMSGSLQGWSAGADAVSLGVALACCCDDLTAAAAAAWAAWATAAAVAMFAVAVCAVAAYRWPGRALCEASQWQTGGQYSQRCL